MRTESGATYGTGFVEGRGPGAPKVLIVAGVSEGECKRLELDIPLVVFKVQCETML